MGLTLEATARQRHPLVPPDPEHVFLAWLLAHPAGADLAVSAAREIERLERFRGAHPGPKGLVQLFVELRCILAPDPECGRAQ